VKYHRGGLVRAHDGLAIDEVPIIAQTGERVLSRQQNRQFEQGMYGGVNITMERVDFRNEQQAEEVFNTISRLLEQRRRARI
jgi:hypothetical protein